MLNLLRYDLRRTVTKEGCAEGDCGACTVVLGELADDRVRFRAVNACILFAPMLDGRALFTVESLGREGALHPVQQAMVDLHGSQCGFCTPGFVMSLLRGATRGRRDRYRQPEGRVGRQPLPLHRLWPNPGGGRGDGRGAGRGHHRRSPGDPAAESLALDHKGRRFFAPRSAGELADVLEVHPDATVLAGGTDVGLWVTKQQRVLETVVSLNEAADLRTIEDLGDTVRLRCGCPLRGRPSRASGSASRVR